MMLVKVNRQFFAIQHVRENQSIHAYAEWMNCSFVQNRTFFSHDSYHPNTNNVKMLNHLSKWRRVLIVVIVETKRDNEPIQHLLCMYVILNFSDISS